MPIRFRAAAMLMGFLLAACGSGGVEEESSTPVEQPESPAAEAAPGRDEILEFFKGLEPECAAHAQQFGNPVVEPARFSGAVIVEERSAGKWLIRDGAGTELVVDTSGDTGGVFSEGEGLPAGEWIVTSVDGPTGVMPIEYSFGCPEKRFVGAAGD